MKKPEAIEGKKVKRIYAGEFYITRKQDVVISTLLGSCVAVCLMDDFNSVYGMNHFMLPEETRRKKFDKTGKYGMKAINLLIDGMVKQGARQKYLRAKIFGGGNVAEAVHNNVAQDNIEFAVKFLEEKGIPIVARDVGDVSGRYIYFCPEDGVYSRKIKLKDEELDKWKR